MRLTIQHTGYDEKKRPLFTLSNGETVTDPVPLSDPKSELVEGYENRPFLENLRWYLEEYLNLPDGPSRRRAEATAAALEAWGTQVFDDLFYRDTYQWYASIREGGHLDKLQIRIISRSPDILSWPWEALCDNRRPGQRTGYFLAPHCCLERLPDPDFSRMPDAGETDRLRMLLVIARPYEDEDVGYHAVSRAVVDDMRRENLPVEISVLRPPTFENLRETLTRAKEEGKPFHIVHFDGHGGYGALTDSADGRGLSNRNATFQGAEGCLVFETAPQPGQKVEPHMVRAGELGQVLFECGVSMAALNACQSAMVDEQAESAYASVAASLLNAGIRSVTAMGYSLYVSGARLFVPAYYRQLFRDGVPAGAMRAGRMAMFQRPERNSLAGKTPLKDWIVPELYQKVPAGARVLPKTTEKYYEPEIGTLYPPDALDQDWDTFIGRGDAILELERLMRRKAAGILIHGMAGAGKTTLAKGFLAWLRDTGGLREEDGTPCPVIWFDFRDGHRESSIVVELANLLCEGVVSAQNEENLRRVVDILKRRRAVIVWDNFESATGAPGTRANLSEEDRQDLKGFLEKLRGGRSKVLITSRTEEAWLTGGTDRICAHMRRDLDGLRGDELWDYCGQIAEELGITLSEDAKREDTPLSGLLEKLYGNPLAVRSVLLRLKDTPAEKLSAELDSAFHGAAGDESTKRIQAAFDVLMKGADADMVPVLQTLGLHEHYANADYVESILGNMAGLEDPKSPEAQNLSQTVTRCFALLESAGLCTHTGNNIYRIHPALRGCLAERYPAPEDVRRWFARCMTYVENRCHSDEKERRAFFSIHEANIRYAQEIAEMLDLRDKDLRLTYALASNANDRGDYGQAEDWLLRLTDKTRRYGDLEGEDRAYNALFMLANKRGDREGAKRWAQKAADVWKDAENLNANILFTMGMNAYAQGNDAIAMQNWEQAAVLWEREGDLRAVAMYGLLGPNAAVQDDNAAAWQWLIKCLEEARDRGNVTIMASASGSLAILADRQGNLCAAEDWYLQSLDLYKQLMDDEGIAKVRCMIGDLYVKMGKPGKARAEFTAAVIIAERLNLKPMIANCKIGLGDAAALEGGFTGARDYWEEALKLYEELRDEELATFVRGKLQRLDKLLNANQQGGHP